MATVVMSGPRFLFRGRKFVHALRDFFRRDPRELPIVTRTFGMGALPDLQIAIEEYARERGADIHAIGYTGSMMFGSSESGLGEMVGQSNFFVSVRVGPVQYRTVDIDVDRQMSCLANGVHLIDSYDGKIAAHVRDHRGSAVALEVRRERAPPSFRS